MRALLILAALLLVLLTFSSLVLGKYHCEEEKSKAASNAALHFINERQQNGYKFKLIKVDSQTVVQKADPCEVTMALTLEETKCHIVNPKSFDDCEVRSEAETKVTAKCNVTLFGGEEKIGIKSYSCDVEPASIDDLAAICPDCPSLLLLNESKGLESVKAAIVKFNKDLIDKSYFKLFDVGRLTTQHNMMFGQTYFAEFALVETECSDDAKAEENSFCKPKCPARRGFCKSTQLGNGDLTVNCEIYDAQNLTHPPHLPFHHAKHCGHHKGHGPHQRHHIGSGHGTRPIHHKKLEHETHPSQHKHSDRTDTVGHRKNARPNCFERFGHRHNRSAAHERGLPHHDHKKDSTKLTKPSHHLLSHRNSTAEDLEHTFIFQRCRCSVKTLPSVHPICPFPSVFNEWDGDSDQGPPAIKRR